MEKLCDHELEREETETMSRQGPLRMIPNMRLRGLHSSYSGANVTPIIVIFQNRYGICNVKQPLYFQNVPSVCFDVDHVSSFCPSKREQQLSSKEYPRLSLQIRMRDTV